MQLSHARRRKDMPNAGCARNPRGGAVRDHLIVPAAVGRRCDTVPSPGGRLQSPDGLKARALGRPRRSTGSLRSLRG
jgi:hypothetical protein